jgi:hypothetical protein
VTKRADPRRRLAAAGALAVVVLGMLAGSRTEAGTAAYVGGVRITDAKVDSVVAAVPANVGASAGDLRDTALTDLTFIEIAKRYAAENHLTLPPVSSDALASQATAMGVSGDPTANPYVVARTTANTYLNYLTSQAPSVAPTDAEIMPGYQNAVAAGVVPPDQLNAYKQNLFQVPTVPKAFGLQRALTAAIKKYRITINPRYAPSCSAAPCRPLQFSLLPLQAGAVGFDAVTLPLTANESNPPVVNAPTPAPTGAPTVSDE